MSTVLLVAILSVSAFVLGTAAASLDGGIFPATGSGPPTVIQRILVVFHRTVTAAGGEANGTVTGGGSRANGTIMVRLTEDGGEGTLVPLSGVNVSIRGGTSALLAALTFHTNLGGVLEFPLHTGEYLVAVSDPRFGISTRVEIFSGKITEVDVTVARETHRVSFYEVVDQDSLGWLSPWSTMTAKIDSTFPDTNGTAPLFLDVDPIPNFLHLNVLVKGQFATLVQFIPAQEIQVTPLGIDRRDSGVWLTLQPKGFVNLTGNPDFWIVRYRPEYRVSTYAA